VLGRVQLEDGRVGARCEGRKSVLTLEQLSASFSEGFGKRAPGAWQFTADGQSGS